MATNIYVGSICDKVYELSSDESYTACPCHTQDCLAEWAPQPLRSRTYNQVLDAFVYFEDANGRVIPAAATHAIPPNGYARREAFTFTDMRKLEARMNQQELDVREKFTEHEQSQREYMIAQERRDLRTMMSHMSELGKDFAREAMRRNDTRLTVYDNRKHPGIHLEALNYDQGHTRED